MKSDELKVERKKEDAIAALLIDRNTEDAARACGIASSTLLRWMEEAEFDLAFRNNIFNPSGFLINRVRNFHKLSRPARVHAQKVSVPLAGEICAKCNGQKYILRKRKIEPCGECSSPEFKTEWEMKGGRTCKKQNGWAKPRN